MNYYELNLKSHTHFPDYEDSCEAPSLEEAVEIFYGRLCKASGEDWDKEVIRKNVDISS